MKDANYYPRSYLMRLDCLYSPKPTVEQSHQNRQHIVTNTSKQQI